MKKYTYLFISIFLTVQIIVPIYGQKTPEDLGRVTFDCFQTNKLDSFFNLIPSFEELRKFGKTIGIDSPSADFNEVKERYPLVVEHFKQECKNIYSDTLVPGFSWTAATLTKIEKSEVNLPLAMSDPAGETILLTIINIHFSSRGADFVLQLGDTHKYDETWKPGNQIKIIREETKTDKSSEDSITLINDQWLKLKNELKKRADLLTSIASVINKLDSSDKQLIKQYTSAGRQFRLYIDSCQILDSTAVQGIYVRNRDLSSVILKMYQLAEPGKVEPERQKLQIRLEAAENRLQYAIKSYNEACIKYTRYDLVFGRHDNPPKATTITF